MGHDEIGYVIEVGRQALWLALIISSPLLIAGLVVGVSISMLQAVTQIHEMTLTFIPKIVAVVGTLLIFMPWMLEKIISFQMYIMEIFPVGFQL